MRKSALAASMLAALLLLAGPAVAATVLVQDEDGAVPFGANIAGINSFYGALPGTTSSMLTGALTSGALSGVGLLWTIQPTSPYTAGEISAMSGFLAAGGRIAFMGEHGGIAAGINANINAAILALGGTTQINATNIEDAGFRSASVGDGQIHAHSLTAGVLLYRYAAFARLIAGAGTEVLMTGEDDPTSIMMGFENIGPGSIFLITDQNVWDVSVISDEVGNDNHVMFANLLNADTGAPPPPGPGNGVPMPASLVLLGLGVLAAAFVSRRRSGR